MFAKVGKRGINPRLCKAWLYEPFGNDVQKVAHAVLLLGAYCNRCACRSVVQEIDEVGAEHILKQHIVAHLV